MLLRVLQVPYNVCERWSMNRWQRGAASTGLLVMMMYNGWSCGNGNGTGEPVWKPATESVAYEVCVHDFVNQPCVQRGEDEAQVYLYRAGKDPAAVDVLYVEEDGRWRVVEK